MNTNLWEEITYQDLMKASDRKRLRHQLLQDLHYLDFLTPRLRDIFADRDDLEVADLSPRLSTELTEAAKAIAERVADFRTKTEPDSLEKRSKSKAERSTKLSGWPQQLKLAEKLIDEIRLRLQLKVETFLHVAGDEPPDDKAVPLYRLCIKELRQELDDLEVIVKEIEEGAKKV